MKASHILLLTLAGAALSFGQDPNGAQPNPDGSLRAAQAQAFSQQPLSFDCEVDGVVVNAATGEPVPRARLSVSAQGSGPGGVSDSSGKWRFTGAPCGGVQLVVSRPGFLPYVYGQRPGRPPARLILFRDMPTHDLRLELPPAAVVTGHILDDAGDPVVNVTVSVMAARVVDGKFSFQPAAGVNSNDIGEFRVANLAAGRYIVCAHRNAPAPTLTTVSTVNPTTLADTCYPGPLEGGQSSTMKIDAGRESRVDFTMVPVSAVHVRGTVSGQPAGRGFGITLTRDPGPGYGVNYPGSVRPDGKFDTAGVPPGAYLLVGNLDDGGRRLYARVPVNVGQADVDNLQVPMQPGFSLTAVVRLDSSHDTRPIPQFGAVLRPAETGGGGGQTKWSEDHRSIVFSELVPRDYQLIVNPVAPFYVQSATIGGQDILRTEAALRPGSGQIEIVLRDDGGAIEGDVSDDMGNPISAGVMAIPRAGRPVTGFAATGGYFKLQNLAPGDYTLYAWDDPQEVAWADADWMKPLAAKGVAVTATAGQTAQIKLTRLAVPAP